MIKIIAVGKIKEQYLKEAIEEYKKRLSKYTKVEIIEVASSNLDLKDKNLMIEAKKIEPLLTAKDYIIVLDINGKQMTSKEMASMIDTVFQKYSNITFVIGGSEGLSDEIKKKANMSFSFSKLTFPHQLFRVMLLEQIYRSYKIMNNETYHK